MSKTYINKVLPSFKNNIYDSYLSYSFALNKLTITENLQYKYNYNKSNLLSFTFYFVFFRYLYLHKCNNFDKISDNEIIITFHVFK